MSFQKKRGLAFIIVLVFVLILAIAAASFVFISSTEIRMTRKQNDSARAFYLAEAAVERAIALLSVNFSENPTGEGQLFDLGEGKYKYEVFSTASSNQMRVIGTGYVPDAATQGCAERVVEVLVTKPSLFELGIFGNTRVSMDSNACIDSYDSEQGAYDSDNPGSNGDVGTNGTTIDPAAISLASNSKIDGDVTIGPISPPDNLENAIDVASNAQITGTKSARSSEEILPQVTAPTGLTDRGSISLGSKDSMTISASGKYSSIHLNSNSCLTVDSDAIIYVTGALTLDSNTELKIADGVKVTIYIDGGLTVPSNSKINNVSQDPTKLDILGTDSLTSVSFDSNSTYYGAMYTRKADITLNSNVNFYGSVIAKKVHLDSNAKIHYDEALARKMDGPRSPNLKVSSWGEAG